ncbi:MAG: biopolymer transporter ExbD [Stagnimonas sp.]|nr:biopolymer transporter ExbD [Stagnimonas sp.]
MGASVKQSGGDEAAPVAEINVTPLVDVMLVLLIIFMVSMPAMMNQLVIEIPKKSSTPPPLNVKPKPTMYVLVDDAGAYYLQFGLDGVPEPVLFEELPAKLIAKADEYSKELVYVKAAPRIDYGRVVLLIETMGKTGYEKVALDKNESAIPLDAPAAPAA